MADYVDDARLIKEITEWQDRVAAQKEAGQQPDEMPAFVQQSVIALAEGMATRHNFRNYSWLDDMVSDAIFAGWRAVPKYDRTNPKESAVGFLNFCMWRAFTGVIKKEKAASDQLKELMMDENYAGFEQGDSDQIVSKNGLISTFSINDME